MPKVTKSRSEPDAAESLKSNQRIPTHPSWHCSPGFLLRHWKHPLTPLENLAQVEFIRLSTWQAMSLVSAYLFTALESANV
jgi:hypothetical protein